MILGIWVFVGLDKFILFILRKVVRKCEFLNNFFVSVLFINFMNNIFIFVEN